MIFALNSYNNKYFDAQYEISVVDEDTGTEDGIIQPLRDRFTFDNNLKKAALLYCVGNSTDLSDICALFRLAENIELEKGYSLFAFTDDDIIELFGQASDRYTSSRIRQQYNVLVRIFDELYDEKAFAGMQINSGKTFLMNHSHQEVKDAIFKLKPRGFSRIIDEQAFQQALITHPNPQESIVPLLLYVGVQMKIDSDQSEIALLEKSDFDGKSLHIKGKHERTIPLDQVGQIIVKRAMSAEGFYIERKTKRIRNNKETLVTRRTELVENNKLIHARKSKVLQDRNQPISPSGLKQRLASFAATYAQVAGIDMKDPEYKLYTRPRAYTEGGKAVFLDRQFAKGLSDEEVIASFAERFGLLNNQMLKSRTLRLYYGVMNIKNKPI